MTLRAARTDIHVAYTGAYLDNCQVVDGAPHAADEEMANRLWDLSEDLVGKKFEI